MIQLVSQLRGFFHINSYLSLSLAITIFSFVGVPPLMGFFAKQMVLSAALDSGYIIMCLIAILTSVIGAVYYRAPLWIYSGRVNFSKRLEKLIALRDLGKEENTEIAKISRNPNDLPEFEMNRGREHVINILDIASAIGYNVREICQGFFITLCRALTDPFDIVNVILVFCSPDNTQDNFVEIRQLKCKPKTNIATIESTAGLPKGSNSYGNGALVLVPQGGSHLRYKGGQCSYSTPAQAVKFNGGDLLSKMEVRDGKYTDLYKLISSEELLFAAYHEIKSKPGNMTPGPDHETLDGVSPNFIKKLSQDLRTEKFRFKPSRREYIPKANGKLRPLGIPSPRDKIVHKAVVIILELIYEQIFLNTSHGFRPNRGCKTALAQMDR